MPTLKFKKGEIKVLQTEPIPENDNRREAQREA
jgi:hypothetical protein